MKIMSAMIAGVAAAGLSAAPALAQESSTTWNGLPDRFQVDTGYFRLSSNVTLRYAGPAGGTGEVDAERDLGQDGQVNTFWVDSTWRVGRRHQLKLAFTRIHREREGQTLQRDFVWGGQTYNAGLTANSTTTSDVLGGYYRFALVRNDRFEIGPALGIGYLWLKAGIEATGTVGGPGGGGSRDLDIDASMGSITGAVGGYVSGWVTKRLVLQGDFLYIKVTLDGNPASVTDWRTAAYYYFFDSAGLGVQYKYNRYEQDRAILESELGGEIQFDGIQVFLSFRF